MKAFATHHDSVHVLCSVYKVPDFKPVRERDEELVLYEAALSLATLEGFSPMVSVSGTSAVLPQA